MSGKKLICLCCEHELEQTEVLYGDPDTHYERKPLCESCYHNDEPVASVYLSDENVPQYISHSRNETEGQFRVKWQPIDPWRGRYVVESDEYANVLSDAILSYHESEEMLAKLNEGILKEFQEKGIDFGRSFSQTSNAFWTRYDVWMKKEPEQILIAHCVLQRLKKEVDYDNPLYSTGILIDRDALKKLQQMLGDKHKIESDTDLMKLVEDKGEDLLDEMQTAVKKSQDASGTSEK